MSIHGNQYLLPLFITPPTIQPIKENDELALAFYLLTKELKFNEKLMSFSRLLWPFLCIQGVISTHIVLDGLGVFSKKGQLTNPPRQPLIGHLLRHTENRTQIEQLNKLVEILTYKDIEAEEIGEGEESEYQKLEITGLVNPEFLYTLVNLLPFVEYQPISEYMPLDTGMSTEQALDIAENYRKMVDYLKGNALRWDSQIELIGKDVEKWLVDLNVQLKDINSLYSSQISKTTQTIDTDQIQKQLALKRDQIDRLKVNERKKVIESISVLFKTVERELEEIIKKNKFFTQTDLLKSKVFEDLVEPFESHFKYLIDEGNKYLQTIESLTLKYMDVKNRVSQIDEEANGKLEEFTASLDLKLKDRDKSLSGFENEKQDKIDKLNELLNNIESLFLQVKNIIQTKNGNCLQEVKDLLTWSLNDNQSELFSRPIQWIYMPLYAVLIEDSDTMEEKMIFLLPGNISNSPESVYYEFSEPMSKLNNLLRENIEEDMALRSNFEFSCETKNLLSEGNFKKKIQLGLSILRNKNVINPEIENKLREKLNLLP